LVAASVHDTNVAAAVADLARLKLSRAGEAGAAARCAARAYREPMPTLDELQAVIGSRERLGSAA
jgi:hypothetical protein